MKKRITAFLLALASAVCLAGCGSILDKEYVYVADYTPPAQAENADGEKVSVRNITSLKNALIGFVESGEKGGTLVFDASYEGDAAQDMQTAVWEIRTRNALCAYCVESINYELSKIVTYSEAVVRINYSESYPVSDIVKLTYAVGVDKLIEEALGENRDKLVLYIGSSTLSAEKIKSTVSQIYRKSPLICISEPSVSVNMYSGTGNQRLYEISFNYGLSAEELENRKAQLTGLEILPELDKSEMGTYELLLSACGYLREKCVYTSDPGRDTAYDALIGCNADSEGLALAFVEVCSRLGCSCTVVEGQKDRVRHFWNIVKIDDYYYHVDVSACIEEDMYSGFLLSDERMWGNYRWDLSTVSRCEGPVLYAPAGIQTAAEEPPSDETLSDEDGLPADGDEAPEEPENGPAGEEPTAGEEEI